MSPIDQDVFWDDDDDEPWYDDLNDWDTWERMTADDEEEEEEEVSES